MNNAGDTNDRQSRQERDARIFIISAGLGALIGLISSYLYTRAADEQGDGEPGSGSSISTGQVLAVLVAVIGLVRQIAELGKPKKSDKRDKK